MESKIIQIANLVEDSKFANPQRGRVYSPKGIAPSLDTKRGGTARAEVFNHTPEKMKSKPKLRYALGRTNHGEGYQTSKFHANRYFNTVTAQQFTGRRQWIAEIGPPVRTR